MKLPIPDEIPDCRELGRVHFIGIGGAALSGIAMIMAECGVTVSGSDAKESATLDRLRAQGIDVRVGHDSALLDNVDTVVVSTAIPEDNPEVVEAIRRGLRVWPRSAATASIMRGRDIVAVSGTDGKTTTTAMLATILVLAKAEPGYLIGSPLQGSGAAAAVGSGPIFVVEADESDASFLVYPARGVVVTNVHIDHLDFYGSAAAYTTAFETFVAQVPTDGFVVCCVDDPGAAKLLDGRGALDAGQPTATIVRAGLGLDASLRATDVHVDATGSSFIVTDGGNTLGHVGLAVIGEHYVADAMCALGAALHLGISFDDAAAALAQYSGTSRRMELKGAVRGITVYDSYAHHPDEIRADLAAARHLTGGGRLIVCFQPHLFSRTRAFGTRMGQELSVADHVIVMDVYPAREPIDPDVTGRLVADAVQRPADEVAFEPDPALVVSLLAATAKPGDVVLTLGAGDVTAIGPMLLDRLAKGEAS
jgi:UDP-N-acetylmuramate--alanine ligase